MEIFLWHWLSPEQQSTLQNVSYGIMKPLLAIIRELFSYREIPIKCICDARNTTRKCYCIRMERSNVLSLFIVTVQWCANYLTFVCFFFFNSEEPKRYLGFKKIHSFCSSFKITFLSRNLCLILTFTVKLLLDVSAFLPHLCVALGKQMQSFSMNYVKKNISKEFVFP